MSFVDVNGNPISIGHVGDSLWDKEFHWNLIDHSKVEKIGSSYYSDFCEVKEGELLMWMWSSATFYADDKSTVIKTVGDIHNYGGKYNVPTGAKYGRWSASNNTFNVYRLGYSENSLSYSSEKPYSDGFPMLANSVKGFQAYVGVLPWHDKRILVIGDSFSAPNVWQAEMCDNLGAICENHSVSGGGWCTGRTKTTYQLASEVTNKPDVIIIAHATNDIANNVPIGSFVQGTSESDYDESTFWGGMQKALTYIRNRWSGVPCYVGTTPAAGLTSGTGEEYIDAMKECCIKYGCVYIETRTCGMAYPLVQNDLQYRKNAGDGHPSTEGQHQIARYMTDLMSGYMSNRDMV